MAKWSRDDLFNEWFRRTPFGRERSDCQWWPTDQHPPGSRVQVEHGYAAKPETCRLFPFNNLRRAGDFLIVAPHTSLCPLAILPSGESSDASDHDQLLAAISAGGIGTHVPETGVAEAEMPALIALERQIIELAEQDLHATR